MASLSRGVVAGALLALSAASCSGGKGKGSDAGTDAGSGGAGGATGTGGAAPVDAGFDAPPATSGQWVMGYYVGYNINAYRLRRSIGRASRTSSSRLWS